LDASDVDNPVFTTLYAHDLNSLIAELQSGRMTPQAAARRLQQMKTALDIPPIGRRPIPNTLPSDRIVSKGILGLILLGSTPCAMSRSDGVQMKLPAPNDANSDRIQISKRKLIAVLYWLGLLPDDREGHRIVGMIHQLWKETIQYSHNLSSFDLELKANKTQRTNGTTEVDEERSMESDLVDLGALRWVIYGIPEQPQSWIGKFCMPCSTPVYPRKPHPIKKAGLSKNSGELVRHDILFCLLCRSATGCPLIDSQQDESSSSHHKEPAARAAHQRLESSTTDDDDALPCIEVTPQVFGSLLREA